MIDLNDRMFKKFKDLIFDFTGIFLSDAKKKLLESRLNKRMRELDLNDYSKYYDLINSNKNSPEFQLFLNAISTNETYFYREKSHFDFILENFPKACKPSFEGGYKIWCCAASTGEEPYSIALTFQQLKNSHRHDFQMLATDINTEVLGIAQKGIYNLKAIDKIPKHLHSQYLQRHKDSRKPIFRVKNELRDKIKFGQFNLIKSNLKQTFLFDVIFCRNVLIYFKNDTKILVVEKLLKQLKPGGFLFIGHSETLVNSGLPIRQVVPTVYQKL